MGLPGFKSPVGKPNDCETLETLVMSLSGLATDGGEIGWNMVKCPLQKPARNFYSGGKFLGFQYIVSSSRIVTNVIPFLKIIILNGGFFNPWGDP